MEATMFEAVGFCVYDEEGLGESNTGLADPARRRQPLAFLIRANVQNSCMLVLDMPLRRDLRPGFFSQNVNARFWHLSNVIM